MQISSATELTVQNPPRSKTSPGAELQPVKELIVKSLNHLFVNEDKQALEGLIKAKTALGRLTSPKNKTERRDSLLGGPKTYIIKEQDIQDLIDFINTKKAFIFALTFTPRELQFWERDLIVQGALEESCKILDISHDEDKRFVINKAISIQQVFPDRDQLANALFKLLGKLIGFACKSDDTSMPVKLSFNYNKKEMGIWEREIVEIITKHYENSPLVQVTQPESFFCPSHTGLCFNVEKLNTPVLEEDTGSLAEIPPEQQRTIDAIANITGEHNINIEELRDNILEGRDNEAIIKLDEAISFVEDKLKAYKFLNAGEDVTETLEEEIPILKGLKNGLITKRALILARVFSPGTLRDGENQSLNAALGELSVRNEDKQQIIARALDISERLEKPSDNAKKSVPVRRFFKAFETSFTVFDSDRELTFDSYNNKPLVTWINELREKTEEKPLLLADERPVDIVTIERNGIESFRPPTNRNGVASHRTSNGRDKYKFGPPVKHIPKYEKANFITDVRTFFSTCKTNTELRELLELYKQDPAILNEVKGLIPESVLFLVNTCNLCTGERRGIVEISDLRHYLNREMSDDSLSRDETIELLDELNDILGTQAFTNEVDILDALDQIDNRIPQVIDRVFKSSVKPLSLDTFLDQALTDDEIQGLELSKIELCRRLKKMGILEENFHALMVLKAYEAYLRLPNSLESSLAIYQNCGTSIDFVPGIICPLKAVFGDSVLENFGLGGFDFAIPPPGKFTSHRPSEANNAVVDRILTRTNKLKTQCLELLRACPNLFKISDEIKVE